MIAPLNAFVPIVDKDGRPTKEFLGWVRQVIDAEKTEAAQLADHETRITALEP